MKRRSFFKSLPGFLGAAAIAVELSKSIQEVPKIRNVKHLVIHSQVDEMENQWILAARKMGKSEQTFERLLASIKNDV